MSLSMGVLEEIHDVKIAEEKTKILRLKRIIFFFLLITCKHKKETNNAYSTNTKARKIQQE